jgi:hypothetical protein
MRTRFWIFAGLVALVFAVNLALVSLRIAQTGEDTVRARLALAGSALRAQVELLDARFSPRAVANLPELIDASRPDERALRAVAGALTPEPDLLAVEIGQGAIVSRRSRPAQQVDDAGKLPLGRAPLEGRPPPAFASWEGGLWRVSAARVPGNNAAVLVGTLVVDRLAAQLKSQVDADVTLLLNGKVVASSLPQGEARAQVARWAAAPSPGYGVLTVILPGVGNALTGKLPLAASRYAVRGALVALDSGVQAALTVPASPYLTWLARYQAFYLVGLAIFILFAFIWGLFSGSAQPPPREVQLPEEQPESAAAPAESPPPSEELPSVGAPPPAEKAPPRPAPAQPPRAESLDPDVPPAGARRSVAQHPMWSADPFTPTPDQIAEEQARSQEAASAPEEPAADPDEEHWRDTFEKFRELKAKLGEPADRISFEKFAAKLRKNREDLIAKHNAKGVRFVVYEKAGKAAIKASAIR